MTVRVVHFSSQISQSIFAFSFIQNSYESFANCHSFASKIPWNRDLWPLYKYHNLHSCHSLEIPLLTIPKIPKVTMSTTPPPVLNYEFSSKKSTSFTKTAPNRPPLSDLDNMRLLLQTSPLSSQMYKNLARYTKTHFTICNALNTIYFKRDPSTFYISLIK